MLTCTRRIQFCAGHRVMGHENKCANLHGHNYVVFITCTGSLDSIGRVIDFSVIKQAVGGWIDQCWDHGLILSIDDTALIEALANGPENKIHLLPTNPTAENMAEYLLKSICPMVLAGSGVVATKIRLWETENCYADARLSSQ